MSDTRPVRWFTGQENPAPKEGEDVILRLVMRQPGSTLSLPRDEAETMGKLDDIPWYFAAEVTDYARVMKGTEEYMTVQYDAEIEDLKRQEKEDELMFGDEVTWTRKAVNVVAEAKEKIKGIGNAPLPAKGAGKKPKKQGLEEVKTVDESPATTWTKIHDGEVDSLSTQSKDFTVPDPIEPTALPIDHSLSHNLEHLAISITPGIVAERVGAAAPPRHVPFAHSHAPYYFYQALQHYYLAPLDIRILKAAFGNFASFPSTLLPRVEHVSTGHIVDDELRKRTKYLAHLPYGCEVSFLECNWTDVVPDSVLATFANEIKKRREKNREKENREEKARQRAEKLEDEERWANVRKKRQGFGTSPQEERFGADDFVPLAPLLDSDTAASSSPPYPTHHRPGFESLAHPSPGTSPSSHQRTVWGTTVLAPSDEGYHYQVEEGGNDGWLLDWEKDLQAENEQILRQVEAASLVDETGEGSANANASAARPIGGGGQGKKKKGKKITLMSTTVRRAA